MTRTLDDLVAKIPDGARLIVPPSRSGPAIAATRALIECGVRNLHIVAIPSSGIQTDMLIGAGCVSIVESAGITLDEFGQAPRFVAAVKAGEIKLMDSTCPAIISAVQAAEKGIPFIPMRGLIGSDLLRHRPDYKVIENPMQAGDKIVVLPAIKPDVALFHAPYADRDGNVWIGSARELMTMAHASHKTLITVEKIIEGDLMSNPETAPACIPSHYIDEVIAHASGSWPLGLAGTSKTDNEAMQDYANLAKSEAGFWEFMAKMSSEASVQ